MTSRWSGVLALILACGSPASIPTAPPETKATSTPVVTTISIGLTTTSQAVDPAVNISWDVLGRANEGVGFFDGNRVELYNLAGNLVARRILLPEDYRGGAGRTFYWGASELSGPWLGQEHTINLLPDQECQFPADPFYPSGPYLAACAGEGGDWSRPRQIVAIDPVTMTPLAELAAASQWPFQDGWAPWVRSGPNGEVVVQFSLECEVPRAYYLEDGAYLALWPESEINTIHLGWTATGGSLLQVLRGGCGTGGPPGIYLQNEANWELVVPGEGTAFRWVEFADPNYNANVRELRLLRAFQALGVEQCCGEPHHGSSSVSAGMTWNGVDLFIGGADLTRFDRSAAVIGNYDVGLVPVTTFAGEPAETDSFACGDTIYGVSAYFDQVSPDRGAVTALIEALGCNP